MAKKQVMNEEDVKIKKVLKYLKKECNIDVDDIEFEKPFSFKAGRGTYDVKKDKFADNIQSRLDILVRSKTSGKNLFVIEVKKEDHKLTDADRDQAISYALLTQPVTPLALTCNGKEIRLYETITRREIKSGEKIEGLNYKVTLSMDKFSEALKFFIGLNNDNLKEFFNEEYIANTSQLIAQNIDDEKTYLPSLYVPDPRLENVFSDFIESEKKAFAISAHSGMGKSCWMCYKAKSMIQSNNFVVFLRFADIKTGIFETIINNFNWNRNFKTITTPQEGISRIDRIIGDKPFYIFIDGLDEGSQADKGMIFDEYFKYSKPNYKLISSCKSYYWTEYKRYHGEISRLYENLYVVSTREEREIKEYEIVELFEHQLHFILEKYKAEYSYTKFITKELKNEFKRNPFTLKIAFQQISEVNDCINLTTTNFILNYIEFLKGKYNIESSEIIFLINFAELIYKENEDRINTKLIFDRIGDIPEVLLRSNILQKNETGTLSSVVEFYYSKLRDYIIAFQVLDLDSKDKSYFDKFKKELTNVRYELLSTYFSIADSNQKKKICDNAYKKAEQFLNKRKELIDQYSSFKQSITPYTLEGIGILCYVDLDSERCISYSFRKMTGDDIDVILEPAELAYTLHFRTQHNATSMHYCYDLDDAFHKRDLKKEIDKIIESNISKNYSRSFSISRNKYMLIERILSFVYLNYERLFDIQLNTSTSPIKSIQYELVRLRELILNKIKDKEANLVIDYIDQLKKLGVARIDDTFLPLLKNFDYFFKYSFSDYSKIDLQQMIEKMYLNFMNEYKIFVEVNFPSICHHFPAYNQCNNKTIIVIDFERQYYYLACLENPTSEVEVEVQDKVIGDEFFNKYLDSVKMLTMGSRHLNGLFSLNNHEIGINIPDCYDILNRTILEHLKSDLKSYNKLTESDILNSFRFDEDKLDEQEMNEINKLVDFAIYNDIMSIENKEFLSGIDKDIVFQLKKMNYFENIRIKSEKISFIKLNPNFMYEYLKTYHEEFQAETDRIILELINSAEIHFMSNKLSESTGIKEVVIKTLIYQLSKIRILRYAESSYTGTYNIVIDDKKLFEKTILKMGSKSKDDIKNGFVESNNI
ncbi:MAG: type I restriction enzyme HsdR N-terminal domain-containing protein [Candidatus Delongbacteria bacterium]|nr:type I restriction enzyme HsdR N-terminal domain-containing protein [Candidatus Delongbacteria bacterium]